MSPTRLECWDYNKISIEESLRERLTLCKQDKFCKDLLNEPRRKCKHFYQVYFKKWEDFLKDK